MIMRKETFAIYTESEIAKDQIMRDLIDCIDFASSSRSLQFQAPSDFLINIFFGQSMDRIMQRPHPLTINLWPPLVSLSLVSLHQSPKLRFGLPVLVQTTPKERKPTPTPWFPKLIKYLWGRRSVLHGHEIRHKCPCHLLRWRRRPCPHYLHEGQASARGTFLSTLKKIKLPLPSSQVKLLFFNLDYSCHPPAHSSMDGEL